MKTQKRPSITSLNAIIGLFILLIPTDMMSVPISQIYSAQVRQFAAKKALLNKKMIQSPTTVLQGHPNTITNCVLSKKGNLIATSCQGETDNLIIWGGNTGIKLHTISVPGGNIVDVLINFDGSRVITISNSQDNNDSNEPNKNTLNLWDSITGNFIKKLEHPAGTIDDICFSFNGNRIVYSIDNTEGSYNIVVADGKTGQQITMSALKTKQYFKLNPKKESMIIYSPKNLTLYDLTVFRKIQSLNQPATPINSFDYESLFYSADGTKIIQNIYDAPSISNETERSITHFIWNSITGKFLTTYIEINQTTDTKETWNSDASKIVTTTPYSNYSSIKEFTIVNGDTFPKLGALNLLMNHRTYSLAYSPDNTIIASAGTGSNNLIIIDAQTCKELRSLNGQPSCTDIELTFSDDSAIIQSHSHPDEKNCTIILWNIATGEQIHKFVGNSSLYSTSENFLKIISPDEKNDHNFILTQLSKPIKPLISTSESRTTVSTLTSMPQQPLPIGTPIARQQVAPPAIKPTPAPLPVIIPAPVARQQVAPQTTPVTPPVAPPATQSRAQSWWNWLTGK